MLQFFTIIRKPLDLLYRLSGAIAAVFMILILTIIVLQMIARWTGQVFPGATNYAGYSMAGSAFFAMAYALNKGAHIRVTLFLSKLGKHRRWGELWCFGIASALSVYFAYFAIKATYWSWKLNDISQGQDAWSIWVPQLSMAFGTTVLAIALCDHLLRIIFVGLTEFEQETVSGTDVE